MATMKTFRLWAASTCVAMTLAFGGATLAAQGKPADATAQCKDGTYSTATTKRGACSGHGGVKTWFADKSAKSDTKAAGKEAKAVGKETKDATKDAAKGTAGAAAGAAAAAGKTTKSAGESVANAVKPKPSSAPADATAKCKDGTYSHASQHRGACSNHGGVAEWYK